MHTSCTVLRMASIWRDIVTRSLELDVRNIDTNCKNPWRWQWLEKEIDGVFLHETIRKLTIAGVAYCLACQKELNYGSRGFVSLTDHVKSTRHKSTIQRRTEHSALPGIGGCSRENESGNAYGFVSFKDFLKEKVDPKLCFNLKTARKLDREEQIKNKSLKEERKKKVNASKEKSLTKRAAKKLSADAARKQRVNHKKGLKNYLNSKSTVNMTKDSEPQQSEKKQVNATKDKSLTKKATKKLSADTASKQRFDLKNNLNSDSTVNMTKDSESQHSKKKQVNATKDKSLTKKATKKLSADAANKQRFDLKNNLNSESTVNMTKDSESQHSENKQVNATKDKSLTKKATKKLSADAASKQRFDLNNLNSESTVNMTKDSEAQQSVKRKLEPNNHKNETKRIKIQKTNKNVLTIKAMFMRANQKK